MKRFWVIVLALSVLIAGFAMAATDILDLSVYSTDELLQLRQQITKELETRISDTPYKENQIYTGKYYVGTDIIAGNYLATCDEKDSRGQIMICKFLEDDPTRYTQQRLITVSGNDRPYYFELREGMFIEVSTKNRLYIVKEDTDFSWKP